MTVLFQRLVERKALLSGDVRREYFDSSNWTEEVGRHPESARICRL